MGTEEKVPLQIVRYDGLTGLPNRVFFNEVLNKSLSFTKRRHQVLAILIIDLFTLDKVNAELGQAMGNAILQEVSNRFTGVLRAEDLLAKLDGNEFIILLNDIGKPKFASVVAEKLLKTCELPIQMGEVAVPLAINIGVCIYPNEANSLEDLLNKADIALHKSRNLGHGVYQFYTPEMDSEAHEFIQLETALGKAISNEELTLYYQPKLHIRQGKIVSVEALIRWAHPEFGMITPEKFIPIAEETGLIIPIGEWVIRQACSTNKHWQEEGYGHITISVNLSSKQFYHPDTAKMIAGILKETGLHPSYLELEINETTVMGDVDLAAQILEKIKATGVKISIDHFGIGYTSISHLKKFPVTVLKIDPTFIRGTPHIPDDMAITSAFISLAHHLGLEVVAEGVETAEQVEYLATQHCDMIQGYFLSRPVPAEKIILQFKKLLDEVLM